MKNLSRKSEGKVIAGVCAGLARSLSMDVTLMRVIWVVGALVTAGLPVIIAYIVLAIILPESDDGSQSVPMGRAGMIAFAAFLIALGAFIIADAVIPYNLSKFILPLFLIGLGVGVIYWTRGKGKKN